MSLTARELADVVGELAPRVAGSRLADISGIGDEEIHFFFETDPARFCLLVSMRSGLARLHASTRPKVRGAPEPSAATRGLAAKLRGAQLLSISASGSDRVVAMHFQLPASAGEPEEPRTAALWFELFSKHTTWVLVGAAERIIAIRAPVQTKTRSLVPGGEYSPPAPPPFEPPPSRFPAPDASRLDTNRAVEAMYGPIAERALREDALQSLARRIDARLTNRSDRGRGLRQRIEEAKDAPAIRRRAELLSSARHTIPRGATEAVLIDYYDSELPQIRIALDPSVPIARAAERLFLKARKLEEGLHLVLREVEIVEQEKRRLEEARRSLEDCADLAALAELAEELEAAKVLPPPARSKTRSQSERRRDPEAEFRRFQSADGVEILVGKNAEQNDRLTFRVARGNDLWLHVGGGAGGSHVVVRLSQEASCPQETLLDAATLAVHYSQSRGAARAEVIVTQRKFVSKARGLPPGKVIVSGERRFLLDLERPRLERLLRPQVG
ncbi:MAG: DUF814 domain-containing protein [Planctomycetes bacterium]|nr:DUF814 domain-containing protein [Planctomycetota bacterium]